MAKVTTPDFFPNFWTRGGKKQPFLNLPVFPVNEAGFCTFHKRSTCVYVCSHSWKALWPKCVHQIWPSASTRASNTQPLLGAPVLPVNKALHGVDAIFCTFHKFLRATRILSCHGPEHLKPTSYRPLTYRRAVSGLPECCCVALGQPISPAARENVWLGGDRSHPLWKSL